MHHHSLIPTGRPRRGSALIQMIVTMAVLSILLTVSGTALVRMYRQQSLQLERIARTAAWQRLARDFRNDVHSATDVSISEDDPTLLVITQTDQTITWVVVNDSIRRVMTGPSSEPQPDIDPRQMPGEAYRFLDATLQITVVSDNDTATFAVVAVTSHEPAGIAEPSTDRIEAHVGRDLNFAPGIVASIAPVN